MEASGAIELLEPRGWRAGPIDLDTAAAVWPILEPHVIRACEHSGGRFTPAGCIQRTLDGEWTMWAVSSPDSECCAVAFVAKREYPDTGLVTLEVALLGGTRIRAWTHLEPLLIEHAHANGASRIEAWSRAGLKDILPHWRRSFVIEREVE